jgi:hypothetical protein
MVYLAFMNLIVLDIDGVLSRGEAQPFDLNLLARLANLNRRAREDDTIPAVTLNTGRPSAYVEAVMQTIDGWQPALYESGAGLYFPQTYQFQLTPALTPAHLAGCGSLSSGSIRRWCRQGEPIGSLVKWFATPYLPIRR